MSDLVLNFELNFTLESLDEPVQSRERFKSLTEEEVKQIARDRNEKSTIYNTSWGVRVLKEWCSLKGVDSSFEMLEADNLNRLLRSFYAEVRNKKGQMYAKMSFVGLRAAIHRHLISEPYNRKINIMADREFREANNVFSGMLKKMKREGLDQSKSKSPISPGDLRKVVNLDTTTPKGLLQLTWFNLGYYFCRRGREGQQELRGDSFLFLKDDDGREYDTMKYNEATKNHPGDLCKDNEPQKHMYATGGPVCPVETLKRYLSLRNPKCPALFQRPIPPNRMQPNTTVWYANVPMGKNTLGGMMKEISKDAALSKCYTNHCIRTTVITELNRCGFDNRTISTLSGHRNEASIRSYCTDASESQKRGMSGSLIKCLAGRENASRTVVGCSGDNANGTSINVGPSLPSPNVRPHVSVTPSLTTLGLTRSTSATRVDINESSSVITQNLSGMHSTFGNCSFSGPVNVYNYMAENH